MFESFSDIIKEFTFVYLEFPVTTYDSMVEVKLKKKWELFKSLRRLK